MAAILISGCGVISGCGDAQPPETQPNPAADAAYGQKVQQLAETTHAAEISFQRKKPDEAAALIEKAEPLSSEVLAVPRPSLAAMEAASDLDDLYGRMLLSNRHYEWALFLFQKCLARWKYWQPQTEDTARRLRRAEAEIEECQRLIAGHAEGSPGK